MRLTAAVTVCVLAATAAPAQADGWYFSESLGGARIENDMDELFDGGFTARLTLGRVFDRFAIEAYLQPIELEGKGEADGGGYTALNLGLSGRYTLPIVGPLGVYVRGGLESMRIEGSYDREDDWVSTYDGRGLHYGAGVRVKGKVRALGFLFFPLFFTDIGPKVTASLYLDSTHQRVRLHSPRARSVDGDIHSWFLGFSIGSDF